MGHAKAGGPLLNMKFAPSLLAADQWGAHLRTLVRSYFRLDGDHVQFNVVTAEMLRAAQADPAAYRDLIVRIAG
jgi:formate C-acetyltransferase